MYNLEPIDCFGYTATCFAPNETQFQLVPLQNGFSECSHAKKVFVDRFDIQLLLEDPSILYEEKDCVTLADLPLSSTEEKSILDVERYRDLYDTTKRFHNVLAGPTRSMRETHHVPTAAEISTRHHHQSGLEDDSSVGTYKKKETASQTPTTKQVFQIDLNSISVGREYVVGFLQEVKGRRQSTQLQMSAFWPKDLYEHLCIERTASLLNTLGSNSDTFFQEFVESLHDEDRLTLSFIFQWHSLNPYYQMIKHLKYCHSNYMKLPKPVEDVLKQSNLLKDDFSQESSEQPMKFEVENEVSSEEEETDSGVIIPNICWESSAGYSKAKERHLRIIQEIAYELVRLQNRNWIKVAMVQLRSPESSLWKRILKFSTLEWNYFRHVMIDVFLCDRKIEQLNKLEHALHSKSQAALDAVVRRYEESTSDEFP